MARRTSRPSTPPPSSRCASGFGEADRASLDDERRLVEHIDEGTYAEQGIRNRQLSSRLIGFSHDLTRNSPPRRWDEGAAFRAKGERGTERLKRISRVRSRPEHGRQRCR